MRYIHIWPFLCFFFKSLDVWLINKQAELRRRPKISSVLSTLVRYEPVMPNPKKGKGKGKKSKVHNYYNNNCYYNIIMMIIVLYCFRNSYCWQVQQAMIACCYFVAAYSHTFSTLECLNYYTLFAYFTIAREAN